MSRNTRSLNLLACTFSDGDLSFFTSLGIPNVCIKEWVDEIASVLHITIGQKGVLIDNVSSLNSLWMRCALHTRFFSWLSKVCNQPWGCFRAVCILRPANLQVYTEHSKFQVKYFTLCSKTFQKLMKTCLELNLNLAWSWDELKISSEQVQE